MTDEKKELVNKFHEAIDGSHECFCEELADIAIAALKPNNEVLIAKVESITEDCELTLRDKGIICVSRNAVEVMLGALKECLTELKR
jgi:activator of HSP90 ATPase